MRVATLSTFLILAITFALPALARQSVSSPPPNPTVTSAPALLVRIQNSAFVPDLATIRIGQSVQFENEDPVGHTATASDGSFDSGYIAKGGSWRTTFSRTGTVQYSDIYHPAMHGTLIIVVN